MSSHEYQPGDLVRFLPGTEPYTLGFRTGVVVDPAVPFAEQVERHVAQNGGDPAVILAGIRANLGLWRRDAWLAMPYLQVRLDPIAAAPGGLLAPIHPSMVEPLDRAARLAN